MVILRRHFIWGFQNSLHFWVSLKPIYDWGSILNGISVVSEVVGAATALAGLILVYLGSLVASFASFAPQEKRSVRAKHQRRAWLAFAARLLSLLAALLGVLAKWLPCEWVADTAVILLFVSFVGASLTALITVLELN